MLFAVNKTPFLIFVQFSVSFMKTLNFTLVLCLPHK